MERFLKFIFFFLVPGGIILWLIYRAVWTLAALHLSQKLPTWHNTELATSWKPAGTEWQEEGGWTTGPKHPFYDWAQGLKEAYYIPWILINPGFYKALFFDKSGVGGGWN